MHAGLLGYSLSLFCSHFPLSVLCERLLYEEPLMGLSGIHWTSVGDWTRCVRACAHTYKCVCFLDSHVGSYIMVPFHLCYCALSHSKAIRFNTKSWSWELWSWESCNRRAGLPPSTLLYSQSLVQYHSQLELQLHFHTHIWTLSLYTFSAAHTWVHWSLGPWMAPVFKYLRACSHKFSPAQAYVVFACIQQMF